MRRARSVVRCKLLSCVGTFLLILNFDVEKEPEFELFTAVDVRGAAT